MKSYTKFVVVLLMSLLLISCNRELPENPVEVSISEQEVEQSVGLEVGDTLEVLLTSVPSTGYMWEVGFYNQSVLKPVGDPEFIKLNTQLGSEELQKLHLEAIGTGETELVFVYQRCFHPEAVEEKTFSVDVTVR